MSCWVLYLSYDGLTDPLGQSQVLPYIKGLCEKGYSFTIISFEKPNRLQSLREEINKICQQHSIRWIPLRYHKRPPVLSTLVDIWQLWRAVKREYKTNAFRIIHCRSYITSLVGLRAKQKWGAKFIFDMRGFWADERVEGGLWNLKNPLYKMVYRYFKKKERQLLTGADHVISLTQSAKNEIESWKLNNAPITVIPTCVDFDLFDPDKIEKYEQAELRLKLGLNEDDFVLLYLGSWGTWYLTKDMLNFFSALKEKKQNAKFLIVSTDKIEVDDFIYKNNVIVTWASRNQVPLYISIAQAAICFINPTFSKKASSATKTGEIMAMNVALIVNEGWGDVDTIIKDQSGVFDKSILASGDFFNQLININSRNSCIEILGLDKGIAKYEYAYQSALSN